LTDILAYADATDGLRRFQAVRLFLSYTGREYFITPIQKPSGPYQFDLIYLWCRSPLQTSSTPASVP